MPNNIDTVKADDSKTLELQVLRADDFADYVSVREFVRSESYHNYSRLIGRVLSSEAPSLSPEEDERARGMAMFFNWDLATLAQAAADTGGPLVVTQAEQEDRPGIVRDLGMVGRAITLSEGWASPAELQRPLFKLIDYHQRLVDAGASRTLPQGKE